MDYRLRDRVALVTGASQGIGFAVARALAAEGARLAICAREPERLRSAARALREAGSPAVAAVPADLARAEDRDRLLAAVRAELGAPGIVVINTGGPPSGAFLALDPARWTEAWALLLESAVHLARLVAPAMVEAGWGRIVAVTSIAVKEPIPDLVLSNSLRAGVAGLMKTLAHELGPRGITVNCVAPGLTATDRLEELFQARAAREGVPVEAVRARAVAGIPAGRAGRPEEVAALAAFLCSEAASYVNGTLIAADGGSTRSLL